MRMLSTTRLVRRPGRVRGTAAILAAGACGVCGSLVTGTAVGATPRVLGVVPTADAHALRPGHGFFVRTGVGDATTQVFSAPAGGFEFSYTFACSGLAGPSGVFLATLGHVPSDGAIAVLAEPPVRDVGAAGRGVRSYRNTGGGLYVQITTDCAWSIALSR